MQGIVQRKITEYDHHWLLSITNSGRNGVQKFWSYVRTFDRKDPHQEDEDTSHAVSYLKGHLASYLKQLFASPPAQPPEAPPAFPCTSAKDSVEQCEWVITLLALDQALVRIGARTAQEWDNIPAGLV